MNSDRLSVVAGLGAVILLGLLVLLPTMIYVVDERELAVVLQFGEPMAERTLPGWYLKMPFLQEVRKLPGHANSGVTHPISPCPICRHAMTRKSRLSPGPCGG